MKKQLTVVLLLLTTILTIFLFSCKPKLEATINFDANGGQFSGGETSLEIEMKKTLEMPSAPSKAGYTFSGWFTDISLASLFDESVFPETDIILYAKWTANDNSVVFDANGGTGTMDNLVIPTGSIHPLTPNSFTKDYYSFLGWATSPSGDVVYSDSADYTMGTETSYTIYAVWELNTVLLTIDYGFFSYNVPADCGTLYVDHVINPNQSAGYTFQGWIADVGEGIEIDETSIVTIDINHTVTAQWLPKVFDVQMDSNGGSFIDAIEVVFNATYGELEIPSRDGYEYLGWFTDRSGGSPIVELSSVMIPANHTLFAHWDPNEYTVSFNSQEGSSVSPKTVTYDGTYGTLASPTRDGYTFDGWYTEASGGVQINSESTVKILENTTLYAKWAIIEYDITYSLANGENHSSNPDSYNTEDDTFNILSPTRAGYTFLGWFESNLTTPADTSIEKGSFGDLEFFAKWQANINQVVFNNNGGEGSMAPMEIATDASANLTLNSFTKTAYAFSGWATSPHSGVVYQDGMGIIMGPLPEYTLYAVWDPIEYDINYTLNNGSNDPSNPASYNVETLTFDIEDPTRSGYTFGGWYEDSELTIPANTHITLGSYGDLTFHAKWVANINDLILDKNGGEGSMSPMQIATDASENLAANTYTRNGYDFYGWATSPSGPKVYNDGASYTMGPLPEYTLYAVWGPIEYDITYSLASGENNSSNPSKYTSESTTFDILDPSRAGYTFLGWYESDLSTPATTHIVQGSYGDLEFYAKWQANINDLIFNSNAGSGVMSAMAIATDDSDNLTANGFTRTGYEFSGWSASPSGSVEYEDEALYIMGPLSEYTLYAVWSPLQYTVTFDKQTGTGGSDQVTATFDSAMPAATKPSKTGYNFQGYFSETSGEGTGYYNYDMVSTTNWNIANNATLYAYWIPKTYIVVFDEQGGEYISQNSKFVTYDAAIGTLATTTKIGHTFIEWNTQNDGGGTTVTSETLYQNESWGYFYAIWQINEYTISFESNGGSAVSSITQNYNTVVTPPADPTKSGFTFAGWYEDEEITSFYTTWKIPPEDITLYADWGTEGLGFFLINDNTEYSVYKGSVDSETSHIRIPRRYNDKYVTAIGDEGENYFTHSFVNMHFTSIYIPSSVTVINQYAFFGVDTFSSISLPDELTYIGENAFYETNITSINIPGSVTEIADYAFHRCTDLSSITFNTGLQKIGREAFAFCTNISSITLPSSVTHLGGFYGNYADAVFSGCSSLTSVTLLATTPPSLSGAGEGITTVFSGAHASLAIYVPSASVNTYKSANGWETYASKISAIS